MKRDDNQHRNRAIAALGDLIGLSPPPSNQVCRGNARYIVDAIMDAVKEEVDVVYTDTGWKYDQRRIFLEGSESPRRFKQLIESGICTYLTET